MIQKAIDDLSMIFGKMVYMVATGGTAIMVFVFLADQLGIEGATYWMALALIIPLAILLGFSFTLLDLAKEARELPYDVGLYVIAGNDFLSAEENALDEHHRIEKKRQLVDLTNNADDVKATEYYKGRNIRSEPSDSFKFYLDSETFLNDNAVTVSQILDNGQSEKLDIIPVHRSSSFEGVYKVEFLEPLEQNEIFELEITSHLGDWDISVGQYLHFNYDRYSIGVDKAQCRVKVDTPPNNIKGYQAVDSSNMSHHNDPMRLDFDIDEIEVREDGNEREFWIEGQDLYDTIYIMRLEW